MLVWTGFVEMRMVRDDQTQLLTFIDCVHVPRDTERETKVAPESRRSAELPFMEVEPLYTRVTKTSLET